MLRTRSYGSVAITSVDRPGLLSGLRERAGRLASEHPEIERVLLFGSLARNEQTPDSDIDLLIVVHEASAPFLERADPYRDTFADLPLDVRPLVYTRRELEFATAESRPFILSAVAEGKTLYPPSVDSSRASTPASNASPTA